ncbi:hypothetical protein Drorol1_Dr00011656 [Drosera rotundifolia]
MDLVSQYTELSTPQTGELSSNSPPSVHLLVVVDSSPHHRHRHRTPNIKMLQLNQLNRTPMDCHDERTWTGTSTGCARQPVNGKRKKYWTNEMLKAKLLRRDQDNCFNRDDNSLHLPNPMIDFLYSLSRLRQYMKHFCPPRLGGLPGTAEASCLLTCVASAKLTEKIRTVVEKWNGEAAV